MKKNQILAVVVVLVISFLNDVYCDSSFDNATLDLGSLRELGRRAGKESSECASQSSCHLDLMRNVNTFRRDFHTMTLKIVAGVPKTLMSAGQLKLASETYQTVSHQKRLTVPEKIRNAGYHVESHEIVTEDGYILTYYRIPYGKNETGKTRHARRPSILIHHGLFGHSGFWITQQPSKNLPYILADLGYDVWLANARGTFVSQRHVKYNISEPVYWDYSYDEKGRYDLPAAFDHILADSGNEKLIYIGHSMGTTIFFVAMSERPEYNKKIELMIALAPVAYVHHATSISTLCAPVGFLPLVYQRYYPLAADEAADLFRKFAYHLCDINSPTVDVCASLYFLVYGFDYNQTDFLRLASFLDEGSNPISVKVLQHFAQNLIWKDFRKMNEGVGRNCEKHGACLPPKYNISKITTKVALFHAANDQLSVTEDVKHLAAELPNLVTCFEVLFKDWNHMDFVIAKDVNELVFNPVIDVIQHQINKLKVNNDTDGGIAKILPAV